MTLPNRKNSVPTVRLGRCTLVGAGPGDPDLLTLKALKAIQAASVLLVDDLVSDAIVALAPAGTRVIAVGKRGGCQSTPQAFIEKLILTSVLEGENVVRLKGGDPFIFGRGGEEAEHLRAAGVHVEIVNGITAGLAGMTQIGAPLTHRDHAHGVLFITGHTRPGAEPIDWPQLAATAHAARLTLVIYMGMKGVAYIAQSLLKNLPLDTPVAVIQNASQPQQRHAIARLDELVQVVDRERLGSPSVVVVGEVVRCAQSFAQWMDSAQLHQASA